MFPVYGVKCLLCKVVPPLSQWWGWNRGVDVAETTVKRLLCCRFWHTGKAMGQSVSVLMEDMSRNKCFSQVQISHVLRFIFICGLYADSHYTVTWYSKLSLSLSMIACFLKTPSVEYLWLEILDIMQQIAFVLVIQATVGSHYVVSVQNNLKTSYKKFHWNVDNNYTSALIQEIVHSDSYVILMNRVMNSRHMQEWHFQFQVRSR
jgi:hypothetical protein